MSKIEQNQAAIEKMEGEFRALAKNHKVADGEVELDGRDIFETNLPEGVTPKVISDLSNHVTNTVSAAHKVIGEVSVGAMAKDKDLDKVMGKVSFGPIGSMKSYVTRSHTGRNPSTQAEVVTIGANRAAVDIFAPGGQRFNAAKEAVKALAADKLK